MDNLDNKVEIEKFQELALVTKDLGKSLISVVEIFTEHISLINQENIELNKRIRDLEKRVRKNNKRRKITLKFK